MTKKLKIDPVSELVEFVSRSQFASFDIYNLTDRTLKCAVRVKKGDKEVVAEGYSRHDSPQELAEMGAEAIQRCVADALNKLEKKGVKL